MTNDLPIWTTRTHWISRKSWTPVCFLSGKVKLLKIIKIDGVLNITRAYTEIFPNADKKKRHFLPTKDRYSLVRCVILKAKARCLKILRETLFELFSLDKDSNINVITTSYCSKTPLRIFSSFKTVYRAVKSVKEPSIMEKYPILQICRTARLKIDWYICKPETFCQCPGKCDFALLLLTSLEKLLSFLLYLFTPVSDRDEWSSNLDTEGALDFEEKLDSWLLFIRKG